jgi:hypothetical protein
MKFSTLIWLIVSCIITVLSIISVLYTDDIIVKISLLFLALAGIIVFTTAAVLLMIQMYRDKQNDSEIYKNY